MLDHCWLITIRKETTSKIPQTLSKEKTALVSGDIVVVKAIVNTELAKDAYKAKIEKYKEKLL